MRTSRIWTGAVMVFATAGAAGAYGQAAQTRAQDFVTPPASNQATLQPDDLYHFQNAGGAELSPDGTMIFYTVTHTDGAGRPAARAMVMTLSSRQSVQLNGGGSAAGGRGAGSARWSPDGQWVAFQGSAGGQSGLWIAKPDGSQGVFLAPIAGTNAPLPGTGNHISWSPDGKQIAFVSSTPGPEASANGDPHVITRYLYKPTASEGVNPYNDNRRLHIFVVDVATKQVRQITDGNYYEHSIQWSPKGDVILFESNRQANPDQDFNYDVFTVSPEGGAIHRLTESVGPKYDAVWSPDGSRIAYTHTVRPITSMETTGEDTHLYIMNADGSGAHLVPGQRDERYGPPTWSADGRFLYDTVQDHGQVRLLRTAAAGGAPEEVIAGDGSVSGASFGKDGTIVYGYSTASSPANLYLLQGGQGAPVQLTDLNHDLLSGKKLGRVVRVEFKSFDGTPVEAFLTEPVDLGDNPAPHSVPMIVNMHGGPHGEQGPEYNNGAQIYAGHGFATLMVNYRGSTGYGQAFEDKILNDQDGGEAKDVLAGVDAAIAKYNWIDPDRLGLEGGSYGGQLTDWIITQTTRFKAAIPAAGISNLVSFNYLSYYHDYMPSEYGGYFNTPARKDMLWERSAIRYADRVTTPVLFIHGANDNDVPTEQAQEYFIALKDAGDETVMVLYPREGHGLSETAHIVDRTNRSLNWYDTHFAAAKK